VKLLKAIVAHESIGLNIIKMYISSAIHNLWFLWAILFCSAAVLIIHCLFKDSLIVYLIVLAVMPFVPDISSSSLYKFMYPYFVVAYLWNKYSVFEKIKETFLKQKYAVTAITFVVYIPLLVMYNHDSYIYTTGISVLGSNGFMQIAIDIYRCRNDCCVRT
jgi:hypothetical protein